MYQVVHTAFRKMAGSFTGSGNQSTPATTANRIPAAMVRSRRKDDAVFIFIAGLLTLLFFVQLGWMILGKF